MAKSFGTEAADQLMQLVRLAESTWGPSPRHDLNIYEIKTRQAAAVERLAPPGSVYRQEAAEIIGRSGPVSDQVAELNGIVRALEADYRAGLMGTVVELVHADLFADFLEMAKELLDKGFKDAAAVIAGSTLEEHLRKLADKVGVAVLGSDGKPRKAEAINQDLGKKAYYTGEQKHVTAWLDLRNEAAHGHYERYDHQRVALLIDSVRAFFGRHPA